MEGDPRGLKRLTAVREESNGVSGTRFLLDLEGSPVRRDTEKVNLDKKRLSGPWLRRLSPHLWKELRV